MSTGLVSAIAASCAFILGLVVAVTFTRRQAKSAMRSADAAASTAKLAHAPKFDISVDEQNNRLIITSQGPDNYASVKLVKLESANPDYAKTPIKLVMDGSSPANAFQLGSLSPKQQTNIKYQRTEEGAGGTIHLTFHCVTDGGAEYAGYASTDIPGEVIPAQPSMAYLVRALARREGTPDDKTLPELEEWFEKLNWAVQSLCACCYGATNGSAASNGHKLSAWSPPQNNSGYSTLEQAVIDLISDALPGALRQVVYYGNEERLAPFRRPGWLGVDPPTLTSSATGAQGEICVPTVLSALRRGKPLYVADVEAPSAPEDKIATMIPRTLPIKHGVYRTLALLPICAFRSFTAADAEDYLLLGALLLQHENRDALGDGRQLALCSLLGNLLGVGIIHHAVKGSNGRSNNGI